MLGRNNLPQELLSIKEKGRYVLEAGGTGKLAERGRQALLPPAPRRKREVSRLSCGTGEGPQDPVHVAPSREQETEGVTDRIPETGREKLQWEVERSLNPSTSHLVRDEIYHPVTRSQLFPLRSDASSYAKTMQSYFMYIRNNILHGKGES